MIYSLRYVSLHLFNLVSCCIFFVNKLVLYSSALVKQKRQRRVSSDLRKDGDIGSMSQPKRLLPFSGFFDASDLHNKMITL